MSVLELYRKGWTLQRIGEEVGVTRERARQIVKVTVKRMATNEFVTNGIVMDQDIMLEEEIRKRKAAQEIERNKGKKNEPKEKRWSFYYTSCQECGTTAIPHIRRGLCEQCCGSFRGERRENIISEHNSQCDSCGKTRAEAQRIYGRDFYITRERKVLCKACFRQYTGKRLGAYKNYEWSRFHPKCKSCGTTSVPHSSKGLCENCSGKVPYGERERLISEKGGTCDDCGMSRKMSRSIFGGDLCVTQTGEVLCRSCFQRYASS